jgi:hypothetical protein
VWFAVQVRRRPYYAPGIFSRQRDAIRLKHYSYRTEQAYVGWIKPYIYFHGVRHPAKMGAPESRS